MRIKIFTFQSSLGKQSWHHPPARPSLYGWPRSSRVGSLDASHLPWWTCGGSTKPHFKIRKSVMSASSSQAFMCQEPLVLVLSCTRIVRMPVYPVPLPSGFSCTAGLPCTPELLPLITPPQKGASGKHCQGGFVRLRHNWDVGGSPSLRSYIRNFKAPCSGFSCLSHHTGALLN